MNDAELDRRVAEIVGWVWLDGDRTNCLYNRQPSTRISDAMAALEAMWAKGWSWQVQCYAGDNGGSLVTLWRLNHPGTKNEIGATIPLAICRAIVATEDDAK